MKAQDDKEFRNATWDGERTYERPAGSAGRRVRTGRRLTGVFLLPFLLSMSGHAVHAQTLIASYPFDGDARDESGNGNHGTVFGATLVPDRFGQPDSALHFDGVDDAIKIGNGVQPDFPFSISLWFKADEMRTAHLFATDEVDFSKSCWGVGVVLGGDGSVGSKTYEGLSTGANRRTHLSAPNAFTVGAWHHLVIVMRGNVDRDIYLDAVLLQGEYSGSGSGISYLGGDGMIGRIRGKVQARPLSWVSGTSSPRLAHLGDLDDIRVYQGDMTAVQVQGLFQHRNVGCNPDSFRAAKPVVGEQWTATVDLEGTTGHAMAMIIAYSGSATVPVGALGCKFLLVDPSSLALMRTCLSPGPVAEFSAEVPDDPALAGTCVYSQAVHYGFAPHWAVSNGQYMTIGS